MIEIVPCATPDKQNVRLAGNLDVRDANSLHVVLNDMVTQGKSGTIDCSALESLDTACVQLLLAAKRDSRGSLQVEFDQDGEVAKWFGYAGVTPRLLEPTCAADRSKNGRTL